MNTMRASGTMVDNNITWSARLIALAGVGLIGYAILFLIVNFTSFIEVRRPPLSSRLTIT